jgi:hypothetical protein
MSSNRLKKLGGNFNNTAFRKVLKQLNGRAILTIVVINKNCEECAKLLKFVGQLEAGFIDKLPQLVLFYGINPTPLDAGSDSGRKEKSREPAGEEGKKEQKRRLADSGILHWDEIPEGHGYGIFLNETDVLYYKGNFDHDEFATNIIDSLRRFRSSIKTLAGLYAKNMFMKKKRTGIIIETSGATQQSQIMELEDKVKSYGSKLSTPVYFCKGINQEITLIVGGETVFRLKGHNLVKFLKKIKTL